jgi:hypothetical protein
MRPALAAVALAATMAACGGSGSDAACRQPVRERLHPDAGLHVLNAGQARYDTDPPTSGPHLFVPPRRGVRDNPLDPAEQVTILEQGDILLQYRDPELAPRLAALVGDKVTVSPNPSLPAAVVATAWTYKLVCDEVDPAALQRFVAAHARAPLH